VKIVDIKLLKRRALRFFFAVEILIFITFYLLGSNGIQCLMVLQAEQKELNYQLRVAKTEVAQLNEQINQWQTTPFFKEKIAREQLQMAREGEEICYLG